MIRYEYVRVSFCYFKLMKQSLYLRKEREVECVNEKVCARLHHRMVARVHRSGLWNRHILRQITNQQKCEGGGRKPKLDHTKTLSLSLFGFGKDNGLISFPLPH